MAVVSYRASLLDSGATQVNAQLGETVRRPFPANVAGQEPARERVTVLDANTPRLLFAQSRTRSQLELRNDGAAAWKPEDRDHVAYRWLDLGGQSLEMEGGPARSALPRSVPPGDSIQVNARLDTPSGFGLYRLRWDVVDAGVGWLSDLEEPTDPAPVVLILPSLSAWLVVAPFAATALLLLARPLRRRWGRLPEARAVLSRRVPLLANGRTRTALGIFLLASFSIGMGLVARHDRQAPTILGDEALYTYKARNFAAHGSYFTPSGTPDSLHFSAPFYSFFLAPLFLVISDSDRAYPLILLLNSLLHASMVFPALKIAEREFPTQKWTVAAAVAVWTIPAGYSQAVMSEALFIPLFVWTGYLYLRVLDNPGWPRTTSVGLAVAVLLLTRFNGVAMLGVVGALTVLAWDCGRLRIARGRELLTRSPMFLVPLLAWVGLRWSRQGSEPKTIHSLAGYAARSASRLEGGMSSVVDYLDLWLHQISYLNLASFGLLTALGIVLAAKRLLGPRAPSSPPPTRGRLLPLKGYFLLAALTMLAASTIYMFVHVGSEKPRFLLYGRHVDMIVPIVVIYALGALEGRPRLLPSWKGRLVVAGGVGLHALLLASVPTIEDTRILCMGAAWQQALLNDHAVSGWLLASASGVLLLGLTAFGAGRARALLLAAALLALNLYNTHLVAASHRLYEVQFAETWTRLREIRDAGGSVYYLTLPNRPRASDSPILAHAAQYVLYDRVARYADPSQLDLERDWVVVQGEIVPAREWLER